MSEVDLEKLLVKYQGKGLPDLPRLGYDGDESIYFDRTKPVVEDDQPFFEECDPEEICFEIERDAIQLADEVERLRLQEWEECHVCRQVVHQSCDLDGTDDGTKPLCRCCYEEHRTEIGRLTAQEYRSHKLATERGQIISECARLIPIAGPLQDRIRFLMRAPRSIEDGAIDYPRWMAEKTADIDRLREALEAYFRAQCRMLKNWAEGDKAVKRKLWQDLHACEEDARAALEKK